MEPDNPLYQDRMRRAEPRALIYELPILAIAAVAGAAGAMIYYILVLRLDPLLQTNLWLWLWIGFSLLGLLLALWAAGYYARGVILYPDRLRLKMLLGYRDFPLSQIESIEALDFERARSTFFSTEYWNTSSAVSGAVLLRRKGKSRAFVFNPMDPERLLIALKNLMGPAEAGSANAPEPGRDPSLAAGSGQGQGPKD